MTTQTTAAPGMQILAEDVPLIAYEAIEAEYQERGVSLSDMLGSFKKGRHTKKTYVNFWHQLMELTKKTPWNTTESEHSKEVIVGPKALNVPENPTEEQLTKSRIRVEANAGPIPDDIWEQIASHMQGRRMRWEKTLDVLTDVAARHGIDHPELGPIVRIAMTVER